MSKKIPQISKTFDQYFSPVDTQINHHDLTLKEFDTAYINHLNATKLLVLVI